MKQFFTRGGLVLASMLASSAVWAQTGVNTTTPHTSAELDITSTTRGLLPPRMNAMQRGAIATPAAGLIVYDTDSAALMLYNGTMWAKVGAGNNGTGPWEQTGNNISNTNTGNIGVGTGAFPNTKLTIYSPNDKGLEVMNNFDTYLTGEFSNSSPNGNALRANAHGGFGVFVSVDSGYAILGWAGKGEGGQFRADKNGGRGVVIAMTDNTSNPSPVGDTAGKALLVYSGKVGIGTGNPDASLHIAGNVKIADGTQGAGKVLTSDANGIASWQTPAGGSGGASQWTTNGNEIYNNNTGKVLVGQTGAIGVANFQVRDYTNNGLGGIAARFVAAGPYSADIFAADSAVSGGPKGCDICTGNSAIFATSNYGDALFATSTNGRGIYLKGGSSFYPAMQIETNGGPTTPALDITGGIKIVDGTQGAGKVLTSDANGNASWQAGGGSGGTSYSAGSGIQISPTNIISAIDNSAINEIQTISLSGSTLSLSNGGGSVTLPSGGGGGTGWTYQSGTANVFQQDVYSGSVNIGSNNPSATSKLNVFAGSQPNAAYFNANTNNDYALETVFGKVSIGAGTSTTEKLAVNGAIKIADASNTPSNGTIRYTAANSFQGYHSGAWTNLSGGGGASSNYAFQASKSVNTSVTSGSSATIIWDNEQYDASNVYNPSTGIFTAPAAGLYHFECNVLAQPSTINKAKGGMKFLKNGANIPGAQMTHNWEITSSSYGETMSLSTTVMLSAGDQVRAEGYIVIPAGVTYEYYGNDISSISGYKVN